jgi:hypothetical protein
MDDEDIIILQIFQKVFGALIGYLIILIPLFLIL